MANAIDDKDGGYWSRKFWLCIGVFAGVLAGGLIAAYIPAFAGQYQVYVGGLLGGFGIYCGANVTQTWGFNKHVGAQMAKASETAKSEVEEDEDPGDEVC